MAKKTSLPPSPADEDVDLDALLAGLDEADDEDDAEDEQGDEAPDEAEKLDLDALLAGLDEEEEEEEDEQQDDGLDLDDLLAGLDEDEDDDLAGRLGAGMDAPPEQEGAPAIDEQFAAEIANARRAAERVAPLRARSAELDDEFRLRPTPALVHTTALLAEQLRVVLDGQRLAAARLRTLIVAAKKQGEAVPNDAKALSAAAPGPRPPLAGTREAIAVLPKVAADLKALVTKVRTLGSRCTTDDLATLAPGLPEALNELTERLDLARAWRAIEGPNPEVDALLKDARAALRPVLEAVKAYVQALVELMRQCLHWTHPRNRLDPAKRPMVDANIEVTAGWFQRARVTLDGVTAAAAALT
jgi:hypothetical protein